MNTSSISQNDLDILVIGAHPDDAEIGCGGTILKHVSLGYKVGILDLTKGELGTRGTPEIRLKESALASEKLGIRLRANLGLEDGFFMNNSGNQLKIISFIRKFRPRIILANAIFDRHPDHGRASSLSMEACFYAGLRKIESNWNQTLKTTTFQYGKKEDMDKESSLNTLQEPYRPLAVYHYIQDRYIKPDFAIDISDFMDLKMEALQTFSSQFYDPNSKEPPSYISSPDFLDSIVSRARELAKPLGTRFAEGFTTDRTFGVKDLFNLI